MTWRYLLKPKHFEKSIWDYEIYEAIKLIDMPGNS